jgi:1-phosphofructokinase family hexose kinase
MGPLVVALNPSIDVEWRVPLVRWEEKNQIVAERRWPGGKGVNVARWLRHLGARPHLLLPLGGNTGQELAAGLRHEHLSATVIPLRETTRANIIVTTEAQGQLRFNPPGPTLSRKEWQEILRGARRELSRADLLILSGSLPRGVPPNAYADLIELARTAGARTLLDCDGSALAAAMKARPFLVKPNVHELSRWAGQELNSLDDIRRAAEKASRRTGGYVLASRGAEGAMLIHASSALCVEVAAPRVRVRNTVGTGDALLAATALQVMAGSSPEMWLRSGVAAGSAAAACIAGELPGKRFTQKLRSGASLFPQERSHEPRDKLSPLRLDVQSRKL